MLLHIFYYIFEVMYFRFVDFDVKTFFLLFKFLLFIILSRSRYICYIEYRLIKMSTDTIRLLFNQFVQIN